ncbi:MAG: exo-beta-N-acetylmuramidase NamZ family protein [Gemmatimonadaceae bacterium]
MIRFGVDRLIADPGLLGDARRVGLVTNDAARLAADSTRHSRLALLEAGVSLTRLFGPEHGLAARAADGAAVADGADPLTGLPVVSLYGERLAPELAMLRDLDMVLFDIPDVGARFYTYTWTLYHMMAACTDALVPLVILDRPNPLGGDLAFAEGPVLEPACRSFIGEDAIPIRHQLTNGELATLWQRERFAGVRLDVFTCDGWRRRMRWPDLDLPWVPTSPAMPSFESAQLYAGTCLFEATNLSVGRGTDAPFQQVGAPWLDTQAVLFDLARRVPKGVELSEVTFVPDSGRFAGEECRGVRIAVTSAAALRPVALGFLLMAAIATTHRLRFQWARYPTAANPSGEGHFERLVGRRGIRRHFDAAPQDIDADLVRRWTDTGDWAARVGAELLYG